MDTEKKIDKLYEAIYEGSDGAPSMKVDIATIKAKMDAPCATGRSNRTLIYWLWAFVLGGGGSILALIIRLHI